MTNLEYALNHLSNLDRIRRDLDAGKVQVNEVDGLCDYFANVIDLIRAIPIKHLERHYLTKVDVNDINYIYNDVITRLEALELSRNTLRYRIMDRDQDFSLADKLRPAYESNRVVPYANYQVNKLPSAYMPKPQPQPKKEKKSLWGWIKSKF